ncbi:unnamed protein product [Sphagnum balticum]
MIDLGLLGSAGVPARIIIASSIGMTRRRCNELAPPSFNTDPLPPAPPLTLFSVPFRDEFVSAHSFVT